MLVALLTVGIFVYLRWNQIDQTLFFQNDMGRDFLVLYDWQKSGKPPLLGPQTNFIPFNQSAFYFYFFFPLFVLLNHSFYTTNVTLSIFYIVFFIAGLYALRKNRDYLIILILSGLLVATHPQIVIQNRYIWNPSFVPLFLCTSFFFFLQIQKNFSTKYLALFSLSVAYAVGMSVSAVPALIAFLVLGIVIFRKNFTKIWKLFIAVCIAHGVVFFPFILFEIKYQFQITSRLFSLLTSGNLAQSTLIPFVEKLTYLNDLWLQSIPNKLFVITGLLVISGYLFYKKKMAGERSLLDEHTQALLLFLVTTLVIVFSPFQLEAHYIFGSLTFLIIFVATLPRLLAVVVTCGALFFWLHPALLASYFVPAPRSTTSLDHCFKSFCAENTQPFFVSVQSVAHSYHYGPEYRYLLKNHGCTVKNIETDPQSAKKMAVISEGLSYVHGQTSYDELTLFGASTETSTSTCTNGLQITILDKN